MTEIPTLVLESKRMSRANQHTTCTLWDVHMYNMCNIGQVQSIRIMAMDACVDSIGRRWSIAGQKLFRNQPNLAVRTTRMPTRIAN